MKTRTLWKNQNTRQMIADFVNYKLESKGYIWPNRLSLPLPNRISRTMRVTGDEFVERYADILDDIFADRMNLTSETTYPRFTEIIQNIFADGVNWGRVVATFAFGGAFAVYCIENEMPYIIDPIGFQTVLRTVLEYFKQY